VHPPTGGTEKPWLVVVRAEPDTDHIIPAIFRAAQNGQRIYLVDVSGRHSKFVARRIAMLESFENVTLQRRGSFKTRHSEWGKLSRIRHCRPVLKHWLRSKNFSLIIHEWWGGIAEQRSMWRRVRDWFFADFPIQLQLIARSLKIPVVAMPHGHSLKVDSIASKTALQVARDSAGLLPFSDRESFEAYVVASESDREFLRKRSDMDVGNVEVWGSPRFSPEWIRRLYGESRIDLRQVHMVSPDAQVVMCFLPKWNNSIEKAPVIELLIRLARECQIVLWLREHPRKDETSLTTSEWKSLEAHHNVRRLRIDEDTTDLIVACDILLEIESSIVIDAVVLGKKVVMPRYLQDSSVILKFDHVDGVVRTHDSDSTIEAVKNLRYSEPCGEEFMRYVAAQIHSDILSYYSSQLTEVARRSL